jgi:prephenate dehydratase
LKTRLGNYFFFINIVGKWEPVLHQNALEELQALDAEVDFLGNYNEYFLKS